MRILLISFISLITIGFSNQSLAGAQCKSNGSCCEELNQMWQEHFSQDFEMFSTSAFKLTESFSCPSHQSRLAEGLVALYQVSNSGSSFTNYYSESSAITQHAGFALALSDIGGFAQTNHDAKLIQFAVVTTEMLSPSTYASTVVHEVEHVERESAHVKCAHGQNKRRKSCDPILGHDLTDNYGAFTSQFIYLSDVRKSDANDLLKKTSKAMMKTLLENQFNKVPKKGPDGVTPIRQYYDL